MMARLLPLILPYISGLLLVTTLYTSYTSSEKSDDIKLQAETIKSLESEIAVGDIQIDALVTAVDIQNEDIRKLAVDREQRVQEYNTRIVTIEKQLELDIEEIRNNGKTSCENVHTTFDDIRTSGL